MLPKMCPPVDRGERAHQNTCYRGPKQAHRGAVRPSQGCAGVPSGILGTCFDFNGPVGHRMNCAACCVLRTAVSWQGGGYAVPC